MITPYDCFNVTVPHTVLYTLCMSLYFLYFHAY